MNGVAAICSLTIDCIYSGFPEYPQMGEELLANNFSMTLGGGSCVTPVKLSAMGVPARLGTFLGDDMLSETARTLLSKFGFENIHNFYRGGEKSPVIFSTVFSFPDDRGILTYDSGINEESLSDDEIYSFLKGSDICFAPRRIEVLKKLKSDGTKLVYDVHWEEGQTLAHHADVLAFADFFTPNDKEALALTQTESVEDALKVLCEYTKHPIIKTGKDGCLTQIGGDLRYFKAHDSKIVDKTGAGDNFLAGLVFGIYHGQPLEKCIYLANAAGGLSTESYGCYAAQYDLNDYLGGKGEIV